MKTIKWKDLKKKALLAIYSTIDKPFNTALTRAIVNAQISEIKLTGKPIVRGGYTKTKEAMKDYAEEFMSQFDIRNAGAVITAVFGDNYTYLGAEYDERGEWVVLYKK